MLVVSEMTPTNRHLNIETINYAINIINILSLLRAEKLYVESFFWASLDYFRLNILAIVFPISSSFSIGSINVGFFKSICEVSVTPACIG